MPTKQMKIHAQFPTFDQQSEEIKSLINFFMEGASVFFRGNYDDPNLPNKMTSYTGEVRFNNRPLLDDSNGIYTPYEMVVPYQDYFPSDFPVVFEPAPQADLSSATELPYVDDNTPVDVTQGIGDYTVTSLTPVKTAMNFYSGASSSDQETSQFILTNTISLPVQIIPKVNDVENDDIKLKPKQIATHQTNVDNLYIQNIPIEDILDSSGNQISDGFVYDFQLRTVTFGLKNTGLLGSSVEEVFYKVGITRLDSSIDLETIVDVLKTASLDITEHSSGNDVRYAGFSLSLASDHSASPSYLLYPTENTIEQHIGTNNINGIATKAIMALQNSSNAIVALIYIKVYNADGSVYDTILDHSDFELYDMEDTSTSVGSLHLDLTDQNIDPIPEP